MSSIKGNNIIEKYFLNFHNTEPNKSTSKKNNQADSLLLSKQFSKCFTYHIIPYLSYQDIISLKCSNKVFSVLLNEKSFKLLILSNSTIHFPSSTLRYSIWAHYLSLPQLIEETISQYNSNKCHATTSESFYSYIIGERDIIKQNSPIPYLSKEKHASVIESFDYIKRDIARSFHNDRFIKGNGKEELCNVLETISSLKNNVGYCQGMNFICGALICLLESESKAFWVFNALLNKYDLSNLFAYNTPDYGVRVYQLNYYLKKYLPNVYYHFKNNDYSFDLLYSKWIMTIFSQYINIENLDWPFSCFIIDKWKGIIKICLIMIYDLQEELLKCDMEGIAILVKDNYMKYHLNWSRSYYLYTTVFKVTSKELKQLHDDYFINLAKVKLSSDDNWAKDQMEPLIRYQNEKGKIEAFVKKDISNYKQLMEEINRRYLIALKKYNEEINYIRSLKNIIDQDAEIKQSYENMYHIYKKEINDLSMINSKTPLRNNENFKSNTIKHDDNNKKKSIIETEFNKLLEKHSFITNKYEQDNLILMKKYEIIDKIKIEMDSIDKEKKKRKDQMEKFLYFTSKKEGELLKILSDHLKLSENYMKTNKF